MSYFNLNHINRITRTARYLLVMLPLIFVSLSAFGQSGVIVDFEHRPENPPLDGVFKIKGDYTLMGNTNLTTLDPMEITNNFNDMKYVDIDEDPNTLNSSMSELVFTNENDVDHACTDILYAGLYWMGRSRESGAASNDVVVGDRTLKRNEMKFKFAGEPYIPIEADSMTEILYPGTDEDYYLCRIRRCHFLCSAARPRPVLWR